MWYTLHRKMRASLEVDAHGGEGRFGLEVERHVRVGPLSWCLGGTVT